MYIDKDVLAKFLEKAYESGWYGSLDLKDDCVASLMKELESLSDISKDIQSKENSYDSYGAYTAPNFNVYRPIDQYYISPDIQPTYNPYVPTQIHQALPSIIYTTSVQPNSTNT